MVYRTGGLFLSALVGFGGALSAFDGGAAMTFFYLVGALLALGLLIYLFAALLKPEWF
jgi:K+-transporting ATPase KdpF subunit